MRAGKSSHTAGHFGTAARASRWLQSAQPPIAGQPPHHGAIFLLDPGLIVFAIGARAGPFELLFTAVALQGLVHEGAVVVRVETAQGKRQLMPNQADALNHQRLFAYHQRRAFGPAAVNVGQGQTVHEAAFMLAAAVFDQVGLTVAWRRFAPIIEGSYRHALPDRRA